MSPKNNWKQRQKPYEDDQDNREALAACPSNEADDAYAAPDRAQPSLIERIGPKFTPPRSLLERMELDGPSKAVPHDFSVNGMDEDGEIRSDAPGPTTYHGPSEDGEVMPDRWDAQASTPQNGFLSRVKYPVRVPSMNGDHPDADRARKPNPERVNTPKETVVDSLQPESNNRSFAVAQKAPAAAKNHASGASVPVDSPSSQTRLPLPLRARLGRALRSAVFQNAKLRDTNAKFDGSKVESKIDTLVTESVSESFEVQMNKVKQEIYTSRTSRRPDEGGPRATLVDELLEGFGNKGASGVGDNTWLKRRASRSRVPSLASTSILPTPPPSELLTWENMNKSPPKAPRAMLGAYSSPVLPPKSTSLKGKEKAIDPPEDTGNVTRERRSSYSSVNMRAEPMHSVPSDSAPRSANFQKRSPPRRASASRSRSPLSAHMRSFRDEMPTYRSPSRSRIRSPPRRQGSLRSHSRSPVRTRRPSHSPAPSSRRSRSPPSNARNFNSRRPRSTSRSPPRSVYSNGFRRPSSRKSRSRSTARNFSRGRTLSGKHPRYPSRSRSPGLNSRNAHDKRMRSPSPYRGRRGDSVLERRSRSPLPRKRKLSHPSPDRTRSPPARRRRSPSFGADDGARGPLPLHRRFNVDAPDSTPHVRNNSGPGMGSLGPQPLMSPFKGGPQPPPVAVPAPPPAPDRAANPCDNVPGLWLVKVGADTSRVLEGTFVVEPGFAAIWDLAAPRSGTPVKSRHNSKISVLLLCLSTAAVSDLYNSLRSSKPSPETMATAVAGLETAWPQDGTLFLDINKGVSTGKTWLPYDIDPASPLDVTEYIQPGPNVIRFIQLAGMVQRTFILYASPSRPRPAPDPVPPDEDEYLFDETPHDNVLFKFDATVSLS